MRPFLLFVSCIIFLTGCATSGYHSVSEPKQNLALLQPDLIGAPQFIWPVKGQLAQSFGSKEGSLAIKGVVIAAKEGASVMSAEAGRVRLVDEKLAGYGKTIIIEHSPAYSTVYARNSEIFVKAGQVVNKGEVIARVGHAGKGATPQLYFEIRKDSRPQDPMRYLS